MDCPVDFVSINENKARLTAFFVLVLSVVYLITGFWLIIAFLLLDFTLRSFNLGKYSVLGFLSDAIIKQLKIKNKPADRAPKRFAAMVGVVFTLAILIAIFFTQTIVAVSLATVLSFFALLEAFFAFCAGCHVYSIGKTIANKF
ncbi:DUF4395 domain-containing protein [Mucilaginibacter sp. X5P1]|uniref:DUF4395 domain-containing protein n=1 Tax=Mucilaginibacter sp. X5P1 TaxID=2723088 RepID=UPI00160802C0|nr:DUF4395 domain-containing protein [Mucilaginibacter sp. X5P1]MBB6136685.1 uncharacterized membrane protein YccF (DUF307 family) [Mucilaginibacter sp. X5P1]